MDINKYTGLNRMKNQNTTLIALENFTKSAILSSSEM